MVIAEKRFDRDGQEQMSKLKPSVTVVVHDLLSVLERRTKSSISCWPVIVWPLPNASRLFPRNNIANHETSMLQTSFPTFHISHATSNQIIPTTNTITSTLVNSSKTNPNPTVQLPFIPKQLRPSPTANLRFRPSTRQNQINIPPPLPEKRT